MTSHEIQKHILSKYEPLKKIGSGAYGDVWKVVDKRKKTIHALKKNFDAFQNSTDAQRTYRQIKFLEKLRHPNIVQLQEIIKAETDKDIYLLFEYMDIDLYTLIRQNILGQRHRRFIIYQIALAMFYLHSAELIHRDIKPSNVLVNENCHAKLCDFGLVRSVDVDQDEDEGSQILTEYIATRWYRAPEILLGSKRYSKAVDVWSFGCLLGEVLRGKPLFPGTSSLNQIERVLTWTGSPSLADIQSLRTDFGKQMLDLLSKIKPISKKDWLPHCSDQAIDLLSKTLQLNPEKRIRMIDVLQHPYLRQFYRPEELVVSDQKLKVEVNDNEKLSIKDYRNLIYKSIKPLQSPQEMRETTKPCRSSKIQDASKTRTSFHENRLKKPSGRSSSKDRQGSVPENGAKESRTISLKKQYDSLMGKREQLSKTKYVKTEEKEGTYHDAARGKKSQNLVKFFWDKKKKSVSIYESKRQSEVLAKYMYKNRYV